MDAAKSASDPSNLMTAVSAAAKVQSKLAEVSKEPVVADNTSK
jgi:hypothetical protein